MWERENPYHIILCIANKMPQIPYSNNEYIPNLFIWWIAYMNEEFLVLPGPLQSSKDEIFQVAIITDLWEVP